MKHGARQYMGCMGEDLEPKETSGNKPLSFQISLKHNLTKPCGSHLLSLSQNSTETKSAQR